MSEPKVYLAGPFFNDAQKGMIARVAEVIENCGFDLFSPWRDVGLLPPGSGSEDRARIFQADVDNLESCDLVVVILDWSMPGNESISGCTTRFVDPGTVWEMGYGYCSHKPMIGYSEDAEIGGLPINLMLTESLLAFAQGPLQLTKVLTAFKPVARRAADEKYGEVVGRIRSEFPVQFESPR